MAESVTIQTPPTGAEAPKVEAPAAGEYIEVAEKPEWVPEKFYDKEHKRISVKALAGSYGELEKGKSSDAPQPKPEEKAGEKPADDSQPKPVVIPGVPAESVAKYTEEVKKDGTLSAASYDELASKGFPKEVVDVYLRGLKGESAVTQGVKDAQDWAKVYDSVGGQEKYAEMTAWASTNMSDSEIDAFNAAATGKNVAAADLAMRGLHAKYSQSIGQELRLVEGEVGDGAGLKPYASVWEMQQDMRTDRYRNDEGFRKMVERRLAKSKIL